MTVRVEDIAAMREREGIDDDDLRADIRGLAVGDLVRITLRADPSPAGETVAVRITAISGATFHGTLVGKPASKGLADLGVGRPLTFTAAHIHSVPSGRKPAGLDRPAARG
jgi:hypothetical protein